jgi:hypothetical protein
VAINPQTKLRGDAEVILIQHDSGNIKVRCFATVVGCCKDDEMHLTFLQMTHNVCGS